jgi:hypothetical protein
MQIIVWGFTKNVKTKINNTIFSKNKQKIQFLHENSMKNESYGDRCGQW